MALSYDAYPADGVTTQFDITFGYLSRSHVFVFVDDVLRSYRWINGTRVELNLAPDPGQTVRVQRLTDRVTRITDFVDGQTLLAGDLDAGDLQNFYILQEIADQVADGVLTGAIPVATASGSGTGGFVTEQWINEQLESNAYSTQAYLQLLQQITDEEIARAQAIASEAAARTAEVAAAALAEAEARAADVLSLTQADLAAGQRLTTLEQTVDDPTTGLSAKVATLETTAVDLENNKAEASVVTAIQSDINDPTTGLKARATSLEDRTTAVENGKADASALDALDIQVNDPTTGLDARATSLESRTTAVENNKADNTTVSAISSDLDALEATVNDPATGLSTKASVTQLTDAVAAESGARTTQINAANARIDGVETSVTNLTQTVADNNQARIDDITQANAATAAAQSDATSALSLVATEKSSRISEVSRLDAQFRAGKGAGTENLLRNGDFSYDPIGYTGLPTGWTNWTNGTLTQINADPWNSEKPVAYMDAAPGTANVGMYQFIYGLTPGASYVITARARRRGGTLVAAGLHTLFRNSANNNLEANNLDFDADGNLEGQSSSSPDGLVTYSKVLTAPPGTDRILIYVMAAWSGFGTNSAGCQIDWYDISLTPLDAGTKTAVDAKATADNNTTLIANETTARASEISRLDAVASAGPNASGIINENPYFRDDPIGFTGIPSKWTNAGGVVGNRVIVEHPDYPGLPCLQVTKPAGTGSQFIFSPSKPCTGGETLKVRARVALVASSTGGWGGAGVFLQQRRDNDDYLGNPPAFVFGSDPDVLGNINSSPVLGKEYVYETEVTLAAAAGLVRAFASENYTPFPGYSTTAEYTIRWHELSIERVSGLSAAVTTLKDALATGSSSQARLFMGVNTANNEAFIEQYAGEGDGVWNGSKITFKADQFEFDGNAIFNADVVNAAGNAINFKRQASAPTAPDGAFWFNTSTNILYIRISGVWQIVGSYSAGDSMTATINTSNLVFSGSGGSFNSPQIACNVSGGTAPYRYKWETIANGVLPGTEKVKGANTPTSATTSLNAQFPSPGTETGQIRCTVVDANGNTKTAVSFYSATRT